MRIDNYSTGLKQWDFKTVRQNDERKKPHPVRHPPLISDDANTTENPVRLPPLQSCDPGTYTCPRKPKIRHPEQTPPIIQLPNETPEPPIVCHMPPRGTDPVETPPIIALPTESTDVPTKAIPGKKPREINPGENSADCCVATVSNRATDSGNISGSS